MRFRTNGRVTATAAVSAAILVPLGVFGAPALARSAAAASQYQYGGSSQYQYKGKVQLCHHTHSKKHPWHVITVSSAAAKAHMRHGDTPAPCPTAPAPTTKHGSAHDAVVQTPSAPHGQSGEQHGQSSEQHGQSGEQHGQSGEEHGQSGSHGNGHGK